jgi:hypothetical protein
MRTKISISILFIILLTSLLTVKGQEKKDVKKTESYVTIVKPVTVDSKGDVNKDLDNLKKAMQESITAQQKSLEESYKKGMMDEVQYKKAIAGLMEQQLKMKEMQKKLSSQYYLKSLGTLGETYVTVPGNHYNIPQSNYSFTEGFPVANMYSRRENNSMNISKTLEDVSLSTDFQYEVKEGTNSASFFVTGTLKAGELKITLKKPDQTAFQEFTISPLADVNWNQQFRWEEEESEGYLGKWTISISASKANGTYSVQVNSR